ncbi:IBR domain protein [Ancylostoma caninum]|uniref:IBR domain protein n=1 Tax=Ancylostoma caninum TaxID=29170 RepID=A0A368G6E4_ANCCA|nr:IBR domain protein [Ancylostoma caninum]
MDMWSLSPDTRKVWNANGLEVDEPLSLWDTVPEEHPPRRRTILKVETEEALRAAERACSVISKRGKLENLDLKDTKPVQVDDDRPYRTWYPALSSKRIPAKEIVVCKPNQRAARGVRWSHVLRHKDIVKELKMREDRLRTDISFGPTARRLLMDHIRGSYRQCRNRSYMVDDIDYFARADVPDSDSDVLRQCSLLSKDYLFLLEFCYTGARNVVVYYPDVNYAIESSRLRETLLSKLGPYRSRKNQKLEVALPGSSKTIAIGDGGTCEELNGASLSLVLNVPLDEDVEQYRQFFCRNSLSARRLNNSESRVLSKYVDLNQGETFENVVRVDFASADDCHEALKKHSPKVAKVLILPRAFVVGSESWSNLKNATMTFRVKWYKRPATGEGVLKFKNAKDSRLAAEILIYHGYSDSERHSRISDDIRIIKVIPNAYQHDYIFQEHMREILGVNDVPLERAYLLRVARWKSDVNDAVRFHVGRAIAKYLMRHHEWIGYLPVFQHEWRMILSSTTLPWHWNMLNIENKEGSANPCEAELIFKSVDQGLGLVDMLTSDNNDLVMYDERNRSSQKITVKPIYCISILVTKEVRIACDSFIRQLNDEESDAARMSDDMLGALEILDTTWTDDLDCSDDTDTTLGELSVQGWPVRHVEEVATRLVSMFEGTYIDCSDDAHGRLLYGYGAKYVDFVRQKLRGRAVIDVDLLRERITVVGEAADLAKEKLTFFARNSHAFELTETIVIGPPRYLYFMRDILHGLVGLERLKKITGCEKLQFIDDLGIKFHGTLQQYDLLMNYLEEVDQRVVQSVSNVNQSSKPDCPVCLSPVSNAFYCLECGHYYCLKCIIFQVKTMIRNRDLPMRCVYMDCEKPIAVTDIKHLILGDERLPWLSAEKLRPLIDSSIDCLVRKHPELTRCPTPDCFGICKKNDGNNEVFRCDSCNKERCRGCMMEPHKDLSCEQYAILRSDGEASLKAYMDQNEGRVRLCPTKGCGAVIEKGEGCNHMQCCVCSMHFCWLCDFTSETQSTVYGHLRETHGAIGEEWPMFGGYVPGERLYPRVPNFVFPIQHPDDLFPIRHPHDDDDDDGFPLPDDMW